MFGLGFRELLLILALVLLLVGAKQLPKLGSGLGGMIQGFRKANRSDDPEPPTTRKADEA
jgi:sec-independent protein translocase protein TatA